MLNGVKQVVVGDWIRRSPILYGRCRSLLASMDAAPLSTRKTLAQRYLTRALRRADRTRLAQAQRHIGSYQDRPYLLKGTLRDAGCDSRLRSVVPVASANTGGTTGIPLTLWRSWTSVVFEQAVVDHLAEAKGVVWKRSRIAILRGDTVKDPSDLTPPFWTLRDGGSQLAMSSNHLTAMTVRHYVAALQRFAPDILWVYPTSLEALCRLTPAGALKLPSLRLIFSSSEVLTPEIRTQARNIGDVPIIDYYGQAERVCASFSSGTGEHFFLPAYGHVELVYSHADDDHDLYEIVGTSYWNGAQPLVRYRTGDYARLPKGTDSKTIEAVTYGMVPFLGVAGRQSDYLVSPDGAHLMGIDHIPRGVPDVVQMQFHQTAPNHVDIHVVPMANYSEVTEQLILRQAQRKIPTSMTISIRRVERLQRTASAKTPLVVRDLAT